MIHYTSKFLDKKVIIDIFLILIVNIVAYLIFSEIDALEWLYKYSLNHEEYELDYLKAERSEINIS